MKLHAGQTQFQLQPEDKIISTSESQDRYVIFSCQHDTADIITWEVNEEGLSNNNMNGDITTGLFSISYYDDIYVQQLKIPTNPLYNETIVECIATFLDGSPEQKTESVSLIYQGIETVYLLLLQYNNHFALSIIYVQIMLCHYQWVSM